MRLRPVHHSEYERLQALAEENRHWFDWLDRADWNAQGPQAWMFAALAPSEQLIGFGRLALHKNRPVLVVSYAVFPDERRKGYGRLIFLRLQTHAHTLGLPVVAGVVKENIAGQALCRSIYGQELYVRKSPDQKDIYVYGDQAAYDAL